MDFEFTEDQKMIIEMVRDFTEKELIPNSSKIDREKKYPIETIKKMHAAGLFGMTVPEEYGGSNAGEVALVQTIMEVAKGCASSSVLLAVTNMVCEIIYKYGNESQRSKFLPMVLGENGLCGAFSLTEPGHGSDAASIETRADKKGDGYILNGAKVFTTNANYSNLFLIYAKTNPTLKHNGISLFIVPSGTEGLTIGKEENKMGLNGSSTASLTLESVRLPRENLLGEENKGFGIAMNALNGGRICVAAQATGIAEAAYNSSRKYAKERRQFDKPLIAFQAISWMLADMATEIEASKGLIFKAALKRESSLEHTLDASSAKLFASEAANRICNKAIQIHGAYGYMKDYPLERYFRDVRATTIYEGTSEIQKIVIAKRVLQSEEPFDD